MRLNLYDWPMLFHVFSAMAWVGSLVGLSTIGRHARRSGGPPQPPISSYAGRGAFA